MLHDDIYNYLIKRHYSTPECSHCQHYKILASRKPCNSCISKNEYKLAKVYTNSIKKMTKDIIKLVKNAIN